MGFVGAGPVVVAPLNDRRRPTTTRASGANGDIARLAVAVAMGVLVATATAPPVVGADAESVTCPVPIAADDAVSDGAGGGVSSAVDVDAVVADSAGVRFVLPPAVAERVVRREVRSECPLRLAVVVSLPGGVLASPDF